jgi:protein-S-isoprenylcysteine O-methyltransferase Ste14
MDPVRAGLPARAAALVYGTLAYAAFLAVFLYAIAFVEDARLSIGQVTLVARTVDHGGTVGPAATALVVDALLLTLFAVQHSVMARPGFKRWWTRLVPAPVERSTYVLLATACLALLMAFWRPVPGIVWDVPDGIIRPALIGVSLAGWLIVLSSTFLINHLDLFGLRQVIAHAQGRRLPSYRFGTPLWYALDLSGLPARILGCTDHDRGTPGVRDRDHQLCPGRDPARREGPGARLRRRVPRLPPPGPHAHPGGTPACLSPIVSPQAGRRRSE